MVEHIDSADHVGGLAWYAAIVALRQFEFHEAKAAWGACGAWDACGSWAGGGAWGAWGAWAIWATRGACGSWAAWAGGGV